MQEATTSVVAQEGTMRHLVMLLLGIALLSPVGATARPQGSSECRYLTSQIEFFETRIERANELRNDLWKNRLGHHLAGLKETRKDRCPGYDDSAVAAQAFQRLVELAAKGALTFFTMGAF
jgi:hypothetical protein